MPMPSNKLIPASAANPSSSHHVHPDHGLPVEVVGVEAVGVVVVEVGVVEVGVVDVDGVVVVVVPDGLPATAVGCAGVMVNGNDVTTVAVPVLGTLPNKPLMVGHALATSCLNVAMLTEVVPDMVPLPLVSVPLRPVTVNGSAQFVKAMGEVVLSTMLVGRVRLLIAPVEELKSAVPVATSFNVPVPWICIPIRVGLLTGAK